MGDYASIQIDFKFLVSSIFQEEKRFSVHFSETCEWYCVACVGVWDVDHHGDGGWLYGKGKKGVCTLFSKPFLRWWWWWCADEKHGKWEGASV